MAAIDEPLKARERARAWALANPERVAEQKRKGAERRKLQNQIRMHQGQAFILAYLKDHPCVDCGEQDVEVLEFDHIRPKKNNVTSLTICREGRISEEIERCDVVCANCHRRRSRRRRADQVVVGSHEELPQFEALTLFSTEDGNPDLFGDY